METRFWFVVPLIPNRTSYCTRPFHWQQVGKLWKLCKQLRDENIQHNHSAEHSVFSRASLIAPICFMSKGIRSTSSTSQKNIEYNRRKEKQKAFLKIKQEKSSSARQACGKSPEKNTWRTDLAKARSLRSAFRRYLKNWNQHFRRLPLSHSLNATKTHIFQANFKSQEIILKFWMRFFVVLLFLENSFGSGLATDVN